MLSNPDLSPEASINHWILLILTFHFILVHVSGTMHGPDDEDFDDWIDDLYGFMHMINTPPHLTPRISPSLYQTLLISSLFPHLIHHLPMPMYLDYSRRSSMMLE
jgi:hypothetical protein